MIAGDSQKILLYRRSGNPILMPSVGGVRVVGGTSVLVGVKLRVGVGVFVFVAMGGSPRVDVAVAAGILEAVAVGVFVNVAVEVFVLVEV
jgi:hypothetical protein